MLKNGENNGKENGQREMREGGREGRGELMERYCSVYDIHYLTNSGTITTTSTNT